MKRAADGSKKAAWMFSFTHIFFIMLSVISCASVVVDHNQNNEDRFQFRSNNAGSDKRRTMGFCSLHRCRRTNFIGHEPTLAGDRI
jgi:hypothetical protein